MLYRLIRLNGNFSGHERDLVYWNQGDGTFADFSAVAGLDAQEDGRAFVAFDYDMDGDLDIVLNNRNSPQLRLMRNDFESGHHSIAFRLEGTKSNRDAAGARLVLETASGRKLTRDVRSGSGFRSQPTRAVYFGLGDETAIKQLTIDWPSGGTETLTNLSAGNIIDVREGQNEPRAHPFKKHDAPEPPPAPHDMISFHPKPGVWLSEFTPAPALNGRRLDGNRYQPQAHRGRRLLVNFWATWCAPCQTELAELKSHRSDFEQAGVTPILVSVDEAGSEDIVRRYIEDKGLPWTVILPDPSTVTAFDLLIRQVLDQSSELGVPATFLIDERGQMVKFYLGRIGVDQILDDVRRWPETPLARDALALPFPGRAYITGFDRNWTQLADAYNSAGLTSEAITALEHAAKAHPNVAGISDRLGVLYGQQGEWDKALAAHQAASKLGALGADGEAHYAAALGEVGRLDEASVVIEKALRQEPDNADALRVAGAIASRQGKFDQAERSLRSSVALSPDNADTQYNLGWLYLQKNRRKEAITAFEKALSLSPRHFQTLHDFGVLYAQSGEWKMAEEYFGKAIEARPDSAEAHYSMGLAYAQEKQYADAEKYFQAAIERRADYAEALTDLAGVYLETKRVREALPVLDKARKTNPQLSQAYLNEARAHLALGDKPKAIATLQALLRVQPQNKVAADALKRLHSQ